tara:strand:- start:155 stop:274 length:120 start_codon:yes stop_codon:yes gene_type:complete
MPDHEIFFGKYGNPKNQIDISRDNSPLNPDEDDEDNGND